MADNSGTSTKPTRTRVGFFILLAIVVTALVRFFNPPQDPSGDMWRFEGMALGTSWSVAIAHPLDRSETAAARVQLAVEAALDQVDSKMSTWREDSELSRFNRHRSTDPFPLSIETLAVLEAAQQISEESGGAFDVTVGPLVNIWGFGPDVRTLTVPDQTTLDGLLRQVGYDNLEIDLDAETARKRLPEIYVDLSAIAKGYAVDVIAESLERLAYENYMVEVGGEIRVGGERPGMEPWRIAIERPVSGQRVVERVVPLSDASLATSGDYRNYYEELGERISHTIDPVTGRPITHKLASVSVIHSTCMMADGYATALLVLGPEKALELAERLKLAVLLLVREGDDFKEVMSSAFQAHADQRTGDAKGP
jgi:FAD:protein FMN transferase